MSLSPSWALSGQATDVGADPHLVPGFHYRLMSHPILGLPVVPLAVGRARLGQLAKGFTRQDVTWIDSRGTPLTAPFTVTPDNPVTAHLPAGFTCCWAVVHTRAVVPEPVRPPVLRLPSLARLPGLLSRLPATVSAEVESIRRVEIRGVADRLDAVLDRTPSAPPATLRVEGRIATAWGDATLAARSAAPYAVHASHLERVVVTGAGTVTGIDWLPANALRQVTPLRSVPLPTGPGPRYAGPVDGEAHAFERVERGAPMRLGLHEQPAAPAPSACGPATRSDEVDRVHQLAASPASAVDRLIHDTSDTQFRLRATESVIDAQGAVLGTASRALLLDVMQGTVDHGLARWLGYLDCDQFPVKEHEVVAYVVEGLYAPDWDALTETGLVAALPAAARVEDPVEAVERLAQLAPELKEHADRARDLAKGPLVHLRVVLAATQGAPLDRPGAPVTGVPVPGAWLPELPPTAVREVTLPLTGLAPGAGLASAMLQDPALPPQPRNAEKPPGRRLLLSARVPGGAGAPGAGEIEDRLVDQRAGTWRVAQTDWFGRWSGWAGASFPAAERPRPPRPTLTHTAAQPTVGVPVPVGPLAGTVRIEVAVPPVEGLPAGGRLLRELALTTTASGAAPVTSVHALATPSHPPDTLVATVPGPALMPATSGTLTMTAAWRDSAGAESDWSEPRVATLHDPRPPAPVIIPPTLAYTARPDATGRARATLTWNVSAGQAAYRVFVADETTLRAKLRDIATGTLAVGDAGQAPPAGVAQSLLDALDAAPDAPARGAVWDAHRTLIPRRWWMQLTADPVPAPASGQVAYTHDVSGSLAVLVLYRVVAVSAASVESDFRSSPLLPRAVPNLLPPPAPTLRVLPVVTGTGRLQALLTLTVPAGPTPAARYRVRRSSATTETAMMTPVIEGSVPPAAAGTAQVVEVIDVGSLPHAARDSLVAWVTYHWRAEVQGAPAPGGGPPGAWSAPSSPVSAATLPPDPPAPVADVSIARDTTGVHVRFTHPDPFTPGASAGYTVEVHRQLPGGPPRRLTALRGQAPPPEGRGSDVTEMFHVTDDDPDAVPGTVYRVVVTDPLGRTSRPSVPVEAP